MTSLFYDDGSLVPEDKASRATMGKSGTVGSISSRGPCSRCGGAGGYRGWPGFTCYRCGGRHSHAFETITVKVYTAQGLERLRRTRERAAVKRNEKARAQAHAQAVEFQTWSENYESLLRDLLHYENDNSFLLDMKTRVSNLTTLSPRQVEVSTEILEREALRAIEDAAASPVPHFEDRTELEVVILDVQYRDNDYGTSLKMLVKHDDGWKLWGTAPRALEDWAVAGPDAPGLEGLKGRRIRFMAKVERSRDDASFGFFNRPSKARIMEPSS